MDRNAKSIGLLGTFGIVGEAFKIIHFKAKLLGNITLVFILPLVLVNLVFGIIVQTHVAEIIFSKTTGELKLLILQLTELLVLNAVYLLLSYALLMPSMAAVVYTVATVDTGNNKPSFAGVMKLVPAVWKRMMITSLWYFIISFMISMAFGFAVCFLAVGFLLFGKSYVIVFYAALIVWFVVLFLVSVYLGIVWKVATVVSVMEEDYYGLEGMKKSRRLLEGKRATAWVVTISYMVINGLVGHAALKGYMHLEGLWAKIAFGTGCVVMEGLVALMWMLTQSVLYFVCKAYHGESIDGNLGEYQATDNKDTESLEPLNI
ncbi:hypothetical protein SUGI_1197350 [Cryptomeria japonica]|uniref:uncharacterized protein LOC131035814 n=1 Tax=Cryptomeria japonica TaxID=3369 RepID=UPI002414861E|nr:uncharacterized protein LOC131035814 [Cryptomeria japonica]GLJ55755.1 hypothetical protein SUGI_1197350 [Cryptomeria japonica]